MKIGKAFRSMEHIDADLIEEAETYKGVKKKNAWFKWGAIAACLCLVAGAIASLIPTVNPSPDAGSGNLPQPGGTNEGAIYSVAVFPAEQSVENVKDAYSEVIYETEAQNEQDLGEYLPREIPNGYHFGCASIYVTTMNDGTIYKMLRATYRTGIEPEAVTDEDGDTLIPGRNDLGDEFVVSIWSFKPDTSIKIYQPDELNEAALSENGDLFYIQFEDVYIGIEPLSLTIDEVVKLVDSILMK